MSDYFPPEIILQILHNLPAKSLIRFTAVCKSWRSIITSPSFISSYLYKPTNETLLLRRYDIDDKQEHYSLLEVSQNRPFTINSSSEIEFPLKSQNGCFRIVGSCRGVICLSEDFFNRKPIIILCNPCIKKHVILPTATVFPELPFVLGFGFADDDFKVVRFVCCRQPAVSIGSQCEGEVFSLREGTWRRLGVDARLQDVKYAWCHLFLNGAVHWLGCNPDKVKDKVSILVFRVVQEVFDEIMLPKELTVGYVLDLYLSLIGESLAVITLGKGSCEVWLMKEYGVEESWTRLYSFSLVDHRYRVLTLRKNGEALMVSKGTELVAFDLENVEAKNLRIQGAANTFYVEDYVESLELLTGESGNLPELSKGEEEDLM